MIKFIESNKIDRYLMMYTAKFDTFLFDQASLMKLFKK